MTVFPSSFLVAASCLLLPASNAFTVPAASGGRLSALLMGPGGQHQNQQQFNRPPPGGDRGPPREDYGPPALRTPHTDHQEMYRPPNRFDQNDSFVNSPYGQANDVKRPTAGQTPAVRLERANIDQWKGEQDKQDAFINGAYGSGGSNRYGLDINGPTGQQQSGQESRRRGRPTRQEPEARSQQNFIDSPYGNKGAPGGYDAPPDMNNRNTQRAPGRRASDPQADFANAPYGNRNGPAGSGVDIGGQQYERYARPEKQQQQRAPDFMDNHSGSNRMEYQGAPEPRYERYSKQDQGQGQGQQRGPRLERFDARRDDKSRYSETNNMADPSSRNGAQDFDPSRYTSPPSRSQEQRHHEQEGGQHQQWGQSARDDFIHNPNGSRNPPGQYGRGTGHGNDSGW